MALWCYIWVLQKLSIQKLLVTYGYLGYKRLNEMGILAS